MTGAAPGRAPAMADPITPVSPARRRALVRIGRRPLEAAT
ncbi:hypothetical protein ISF6_3519 [Piscinibacter sakaiensis]|uniref:Uncharacterized protein n=1 Tax=Piscinibacter sakaiensis TaxID=1547922 RepID=A0A0K8P4V7_PISS1|nr:hypothetical protein ISF6_3519 [Piscinibacter sakaiensis]